MKDRSPPASQPPEQAARLLRAEGMAAFAAALREMDGFADAVLLWSTGPGDVQAFPSQAAVDPAWLGVAPGDALRLPEAGATVLGLAAQGPARVALRLPGSDGGRAPQLAHFASNALDKELLRQSVARLERAEGLQRALYEITDMAGSDLDMPAMLAGLHRIVGRLMYAENFFIALYDADSDTIRFAYFADVADDEWQDPDAVEPMAQIEGSLTWHLIRGRRPLMGPTSTLYRELEGPVSAIGPGAADWLGVPILGGGRVRGAMVVQSYERGGLYTEAERDLLSYVGTHIVTAIDRKHAFERLEQRTRELGEQIAVRREIERRLQHEVLHDPLTGLPNRAYLRDHLARAIAGFARDPGRRFAVLFMDLDRFKIINDSAGHSVGDELLRVVAQRFSACLRPSDVVARLGGDEFAVLVHDVDDGDAPVRLAQRLIDALREPVRVDGRELFTGVSVGIAMGSAAYATPEELLRDADIAMYRVKERARGGFELFDERLHHQALELLALEGDLRQGLARGEFEPHFQPILRLADGTLTGYEALVRWNHPTRGLLAPGAFLRVAEAGGLLEPLDWQLYEQVFRLVPTLLRDDQCVHINVPPRHFLADGLDTRLLGLMRRHGVKPAQVRIEITEDVLVDNPDRVGACIDRLRAAGVFTALDDFGTGYSSLSYLHRFGFHTLKLDRSFIADLGAGDAQVATAVVRAVVELAGALGLTVIAEGVETAAQREAVQALGCGYGQGWLFGRPAPATRWTA